MIADAVYDGRQRFVLLGRRQPVSDGGSFPLTQTSIGVAYEEVGLVEILVIGHQEAPVSRRHTASGRDCCDLCAQKSQLVENSRRNGEFWRCWVGSDVDAQCATVNT